MFTSWIFNPTSPSSSSCLPETFAVCHFDAISRNCIPFYCNQIWIYNPSNAPNPPFLSRGEREDETLVVVVNWILRAAHWFPSCVEKWEGEQLGVVMSVGLCDYGPMIKVRRSQNTIPGLFAILLRFSHFLGLVSGPWITIKLHTGMIVL